MICLYPLSGEAEITELQHALFAYQEILRLYIPVDDSLFMHVVDCFYKLVNVLSNTFTL